MTSDDLAKLKAALEAAGEHVISALEVAENASPENNVFISGPGQGSHSFDSSAWLIDFGISTWKEVSDNLVHMLSDNLVHGFVMCVEPLPAPVANYVEHAIIAHLHSGDTIALAKLNAAFPTDDEHVIEVPQLVRKDAAIHPLSIYNFNGRSLDSHNPWHMERSFESYLEGEIEAEADLSNPRIPSVSKNPINDNIGLIDSSFEVTKASSAFFELSSRNKVADSIASIPALSGEEGGNKLSPHFHSLEDCIVNDRGNTEVPHGILDSMQRNSRALLAA